MKVVIFCGGFGMRIREYSDIVPKPMVPIGPRPILWNVMRYYAHFGHKDFILCLGHQAEVIKNYFLNYNEALSNDFVISGGGKQIKLLSSDIHDWTITFADTGLRSNIGQRLKAVEKYLDDEEIFLANYSDGLTDFHLPDAIEHFKRKNAIASFLAVKPSQSFDVVRTRDGDEVEALEHVTKSGMMVNAGYFTFRHEIFDYIKEGEELVYEPFRRLMKERRLVAYKYDGFFLSMDTFKEKQMIDEMSARGETPWEVWHTPNVADENGPAGAARTPASG